jgi:succinate dehydrogenase / fumarate reductase cytochrome b subunit
MLVSILHRATGTAMAIGGVLILLWWLVALASGPETYAIFHGWVIGGDPAQPEHPVVNLLARIAGVGLTWAFFQHLCNGLRHFVLDTGAGYELKTNKFWAVMTLVIAIAATAAVWLPILVRF